jgi:mRNA interferase MazF
VDIDLQETQNIIDSTKEQVYLQGKTHTGNRAKPHRGQVFNCHLGVGVGSEFQKRRPCVVLSNNVNNVNNSIVIVAPITHTQKDLPICVPIADKRGADGALILNGCANLSGLRSVSSYRLAGMICELENEEMNRIDAAIARHLDVMRHYSTLQSVIQDNKDHIERLNSVLERLCKMTGVENNKDLIAAVESLIAQK